MISPGEAYVLTFCDAHPEISVPPGTATLLTKGTSSIIDTPIASLHTLPLKHLPEETREKGASQWRDQEGLNIRQRSLRSSSAVPMRAFISDHLVRPRA